MSPLCNSSAPDATLCGTVTNGDQTVSNLTVTRDPDDEDDVIWVPYLSVICLIAVCITLGTSFYRYWKRVKKRRRNIQDYIDYNIDLNRKRLFGMMRAPFDLSQEHFNASSDGSDYPHHTKHSFYNRYQYSHEFPPARGTMGLQGGGGGLQRYESMASAIHGMALNNSMERHCPRHECQNQRDMSLESKQPCYHHCFVTCQFCWPVFQNELRILLKSTRDDLYDEQDKSITGRSFDYRDSHAKLDDYNERRTVRIIEGNDLSTSDFSKWNSSENRKKFRSFEKEEYGIEYQEMSADNGARPKVNKRDSGFWLKKQKATEQSEENDCIQETSSIETARNTRVHSDSDLQQRKMKTRAKNRDFLIKTGAVYSEDLSAAPSSVIENSHIERPEKKRILLPGLTPPSPPLRPQFTGTHAIDSPNSRSVAFANTIFREAGSPSDQAPPLFAENGGVINYGFQTDSLSSLSTSHANMADAKTLSLATVSNQNLTNFHNETEVIGSPSTGRKKKKSFQKNRRQLSDASTSSSFVKERDVGNYSQTESGRNSWPQPQIPHPRADSIDLSVIDIDSVTVASTSTQSAGVLPIYNSLGANNDINV